MIKWTYNPEKPSDLALTIARDIFSTGDQSNDKCQRLQCMGGDWQGEETNLGGFCESALAQRIDASLKSASDEKGQ